MRVFLASEFRCYVYKGEFYLLSKAYYIYKRYAEAFGDIVLCSRFVEVDEIPVDCMKADFITQSIVCDSLSKALLGGYREQMMTAMKQCGLVVGRFPSIIAFRARDCARKLGKVFLAELMCDGWDSYWNHGLTGKLIAPYMTTKMKSCTWDADFAVYVTEKFLQSKYPCKNPSIHASNVVITDTDPEILNRRLEKIRQTDPRNISMMTSASVDLHSKGQEYAVKAMGLLKQKGTHVTYYLAGDGDPEYLRKFAREAGVEEDLVFLGRLPLEKVFEMLDEIDIYIQPSLQEGLPRSVIEAMSRGCPVLGARTAGIPELMDAECVFERASAQSIAEKMESMLENGLEKYAQHNFTHAQDYRTDVLDSRRTQYFEMIKEHI